MSKLLQRAVSSLALTPPAPREYSHASLNEHMLTKSLTRSLEERNWRRVAFIAAGWALNLVCFLGLLLVFVLYGYAPLVCLCMFIHMVLRMRMHP